MTPTLRTIAKTIQDMIAARAPTASICPSEVARALQPDEHAWRSLMPRVRDVAATLQDEGRIRITRGDQPVSRETLHHGPIRLRRADKTPHDPPKGE